MLVQDLGNLRGDLDTLGTPSAHGTALCNIMFIQGKAISEKENLWIKGAPIRLWSDLEKWRHLCKANPT